MVFYPSSQKRLARAAAREAEMLEAAAKDRQLAEAREAKEAMEAAEAEEANKAAEARKSAEALRAAEAAREAAEAERAADAARKAAKAAKVVKSAGKIPPKPDAGTEGVRRHKDVSFGVIWLCRILCLPGVAHLTDVCSISRLYSRSLRVNTLAATLETR